MSPFLTTLGGGSSRGFGRGRFRSLISSLPFVNITSITDDAYGTATVNYTTNRSSGYDTYFYFNGNNGATFYYVNTVGSYQLYVGNCQTWSYQVKLRNQTTGVFEAQSNVVNYTTGIAAGSTVSTTCSGCNLITTLSNGVCGSTYNTTFNNSYSCCSPLSGWQFTNPNSGGYVSWYVSSNAPDNWAIYYDLIHQDSNSAVTGGSFGGFGNTFTSGTQQVFPNAGPGYYYIISSIGMGPPNNRYEDYYNGSAEPVYLS